MNTSTFELRLEAVLSAALQSNMPTEQVVTSVNRLLGAFKEIGYTQNRTASPFEPLAFEEDFVLN